MKLRWNLPGDLLSELQIKTSCNSNRYAPSCDLWLQRNHRRRRTNPFKAI